MKSRHDLFDDYLEKPILRFLTTSVERGSTNGTIEKSIWPFNKNDQETHIEVFVIFNERQKTK